MMSSLKTHRLYFLANVRPLHTRERERGGEGERERERECVSVCVCVCPAHEMVFFSVALLSGRALLRIFSRTDVLALIRE